MEKLIYILVVSLILVFAIIIFYFKKNTRKGYVLISFKDKLNDDFDNLSKTLSDAQAYVLSKLLKSDLGQIRYLQVYNVYKSGLSHETMIKKTREDVTKINKLLIEEYDLSFNPLLTQRDKNDKRNRVIILNPLCDNPIKSIQNDLIRGVF